LEALARSAEREE
jgi:hypothetical protein